MNQKKIAFVGLDDGNYDSKVYVKKFDSNNNLIESINFSIPSRIAYGEIIISNGMHGVGNNGSIYYHNDISYTIIDKDDKSIYSDIVDLRSIEYPLSIENVIIAKHVLKMAGLDESYDVYLVTGLPYREYFNGKAQKNEEIIRAKKESFKRMNQIMCKDETATSPNIVSHEIMAEGVGAYLNSVIDDTGGDSDNLITQELTTSPVSFVDIGGRTLDVVTFTQQGQNLINNFSNTHNLGVLDLNEQIGAEIKEVFGLKHIIPNKIESAIRSGTYTAKGQVLDVSEIIHQKKMIFAKRLEMEVKKILKDAENIGLIVFVGGGSILLKDCLQDIYENSFFVDNPQFANAHGFLKASMFMFPNAIFN